jgi:hypothetical protein
VTITHDWKENAVGDGEDVGRGLVALDESCRESLAGSYLDPLGDRSRPGENGSGQGAKESHVLTVVNYDATALSRFVEYLSKVALQPLTDRELQALESVLDLSMDELPSERRLDSVQTSSRTSAASPDRGAVA